MTVTYLVTSKINAGYVKQGMINILYIHGLNSSGQSRTATEMQRCLPPNYHIISPNIPQQADVAMTVVRDTIRNEKINIVVGSSLGAFIALNLRNVMKIVINPCLHPEIELPKLGETSIIPGYEELSNTCFTNIDAEEREITFGIFGRHDELFSYPTEFSKYYNYIATINDGHRISPKHIKDTLCPLIEYIVNKHIPELARKLNGSPMI